MQRPTHTVAYATVAALAGLAIFLAVAAYLL